MHWNDQISSDGSLNWSRRGGVGDSRSGAFNNSGRKRLLLLLWLRRRRRRGRGKGRKNDRYLRQLSIVCFFNCVHAVLFNCAFQAKQNDNKGTVHTHRSIQQSHNTHSISLCPNRPLSSS
uniref:Uncharacterized protein n=1 Tax=Rodentolepis nana TaxID=102285 RepID=A0A0R3T5P2_RODNA